MSTNINNSVINISKNSFFSGEEDYQLIPFFGNNEREISTRVQELAAVNKGIQQVNETRKLLYQASIDAQEAECTIAERQAKNIYMLESTKNKILSKQIDTDIKKERLNREIERTDFYRRRADEHINLLKTKDIDPVIALAFTAEGMDKTRASIVEKHYDHLVQLRGLERNTYDSDLTTKYAKEAREIELAASNERLSIQKRAEILAMIEDLKFKELKRISVLNINDIERERLYNEANTFFGIWKEKLG